MTKKTNNAITTIILTALFLLFLYLSARGYAKAIMLWQKRALDSAKDRNAVDELGKKITLTIAMFLFFMFLVECFIHQELTITGYSFYVSEFIFIFGLLLQIFFWADANFKSISTKPKQSI